MKKLWIIGGLAVLLAIAATTYFLFQPKTLKLDGLVQAQEMRDASRFGGRVLEVYVKEGDSVKAGDPIVLFDNSELKAKVSQAKAQLTQAKAKESLLLAGADATDLRQARAAVRQAEQNLAISRKSADSMSAQADAKLKSAQAAYEKAKAAYDNAPTMLEEGIISQQKYENIMASYQEAESVLKAAEQAVSQSQIAPKSEQVKIAQSQLDAARANYSKLISGAKKQELEIVTAATEQAESQLEALEAQLTEMTVNSKIDGVVSVFSLVAGDLVLPGQPIVSILNYDNLWADVYVPETDLDLVRVNQPVSAKTTTYGKKILFKGKVAAINPKSEFVPSNQSAEAGEENAFRVKVRLDRYVNESDEKNKKELYPGMKVTIEFLPTS